MTEQERSELEGLIQTLRERLREADLWARDSNLEEDQKAYWEGKSFAYWEAMTLLAKTIKEAE